MKTGSAAPRQPGGLGRPTRLLEPRALAPARQPGDRHQAGQHQDAGFRLRNGRDAPEGEDVVVVVLVAAPQDVFEADQGGPRRPALYVTTCVGQPVRIAGGGAGVEEVAGLVTISAKSSTVPAANEPMLKVSPGEVEWFGKNGTPLLTRIRLL